jgi:hypothetical protein
VCRITLVLPMLQLAFVRFLNQVVERVGVDYYGGEPFFTNNWKCQTILTFYKPAEPEAPLFDVCSGVCDTPPQAEECTSTRSSLF